MGTDPNAGKKSCPVQASFLRELRKRCGWTQEELAERTGLSGRSIRNAEAGKPIHLRSIRTLCDVLNHELTLTLSPVQLLESPLIALKSSHDPSTILNRLLFGMYDDENFRLEDFVAEQVVYYCEIGVLLGIDEVKRRLSAVRISSGMFRPSICAIAASGPYAAASWSYKRPDSLTERHGSDEGHGSICIREKNGLVVEAWDFPACIDHLKVPPSAPQRTILSRSVRVNCELVRAKRCAEAMTQEDLAARSGLSLRLIRSAERGNAISPRSCGLLASALSMPSSAIEVASADAVSQSLMGRRAKEYLEEIWNRQNYEVIETHLTEKFRFHHETGIVSDRAEMKSRIQEFRKSFGEFHFTVTSALDFGSFVVCKWQVKMTHIGLWFGIAPTGTRVTVNGATWVHVIGEQFGDAWDFWKPEVVLSRLRRA